MKKSPFHLQTIKWEDFCSIHSSTTTVGYHIKSVPGSVSMAPFQPLSSSPGVSSRNTSSPRTSSESHRHPAIELVPRSKDCPWISILGIFFWNPGSSKLRPDIFLVARKKVKYSLHGNYRGRKNCLGGLDCEFWTSCMSISGFSEVFQVLCETFKYHSAFFLEFAQIWTTTKHKTYCTTKKEGSNASSRSERIPERKPNDTWRFYHVSYRTLKISENPKIDLQ